VKVKFQKELKSVYYKSSSKQQQLDVWKDDQIDKINNLSFAAFKEQFRNSVAEKRFVTNLFDCIKLSDGTKLERVSLNDLLDSVGDFENQIHIIKSEDKYYPAERIHGTKACTYV
jgi:hypothetical protein